MYTQAGVVFARDWPEFIAGPRSVLTDHPDNRLRHASVHGIAKLTGTGASAFPAGTLARRGIEPALPLAYTVFSLETVGALCIIAGLFTRPIAAALAIKLAVVTFVAHLPNGDSWSSPRGGWEYPLLGT